MTLFDKSVVCNRCGQRFALTVSCSGTVRDGDLEVQYFSCPACGAKYHILTTDSTMRELIERRKAVLLKLKAARAKRFRERVFQKYLREHEQIKKVQEKIFPELKAQGEKLLCGGEPGE